MYGELNDHEIDALLKRHRFGRLGFTLKDELFIIPINYAYDGAHIYGHAALGTKVAGMRQNPHVAFEIDEVDDPAHWRTVLLQGRYAELHERAEKEAAFRRILAQGGGGERSEVTWAMSVDNLVVFAIVPTQRSGRFEQRETQPFGRDRTGPYRRRPAARDRHMPAGTWNIDTQKELVQ